MSLDVPSVLYTSTLNLNLKVIQQYIYLASWRFYFIRSPTDLAAKCKEILWMYPHF